MDKLLSIIVPVYNVSKYLGRCVDSILAQTYKNIEVILVDDGSPDDCGMICDYYKGKDSRVIAIHKTNGGLSSARNAGLDIAKGDLIGFVDSDDWIEPTMYEEMVKLMDEAHCNMVECAVNRIYGQSKVVVRPKKNEIVTGREALRRHLDTIHNYMMPRPAVWSKLYKKAFWTKNRFPVGEIHEDYLLTCMILYESLTIGLLHKGLYNHLIDNPNSICNTRFSKRNLYSVNQFEYRIDYLASKNDVELLSYAKVAYYSYLTTVIWKCKLNGLIEYKKYIEVIRKDKKEINSLTFNHKNKIYIFLIIHCPSLYINYRNLISNIIMFREFIKKR